MPRKYLKLTESEKMAMIQECRTSGLSDYQWCKSKGISASSFYRWIENLKRKSYSIPESVELIQPKQEVVKLTVPSPAVPSDRYNVQAPPCDTPVSMVIKCGGISIDINNNVDRLLLADMLHMLRSLSC